MAKDIPATAEQLASFGISLDDAKGLRQGTILNCLSFRRETDIIVNADGTPARLKVTSVKTWKRSPERVEIRVSRGLYEHYTLDASDLHRLHVEVA